MKSIELTSKQAYKYLEYCQEAKAKLDQQIRLLRVEMREYEDIIEKIKDNYTAIPLREKPRRFVSKEYKPQERELFRYDTSWKLDAKIDYLAKENDAFFTYLDMVDMILAFEPSLRSKRDTLKKSISARLSVRGGEDLFAFKPESSVITYYGLREWVKDNKPIDRYAGRWVTE